MATRQNLLSPEELSALSEGLKDGSLEADTGFNTGVRVRKHDLASENSSLGVNVSSIDMINERFIRMFRLGLLEVLRTTPRVNPTRVQIMKFGDYLGIGAGAHSKLSFAHRVLRQVRNRDPRLFMDHALDTSRADRAVAQSTEVARAELPFEFMLNALRLRHGFSLADFTDRTGLPVTAIQAALTEAEAKGLITRDFQRVVPTERGFDFLSNLQSLFLSEA